MLGSTTAPGRPGARVGAPARVAFHSTHSVGVPRVLFSRLNTQPMRTPVNASPKPSRVSAHDSGTVWFATPSLAETCTLYSLPVSRRTRCQVKQPQREMGPDLPFARPYNLRPGYNRSWFAKRKLDKALLRHTLPPSLVITVSGYHHDWQVGKPLLDLDQQLQSVHTGHIDAGEDRYQRRLDFTREPIQCLTLFRQRFRGYGKVPPIRMRCVPPEWNGTASQGSGAVRSGCLFRVEMRQ